MSVVRHGRVEYGARAFEQDASQAIKGDVVRALIELITNADDAYAGREGQILVRVLKSDEVDMPTRIQVQDAAVGLSAKGLERNFAILGGAKAADEANEHARGLLGRGAKDVASLGKVCFEAVRDGKYSRMTLASTGDWALTNENENVTREQHTTLALDDEQNGLTATVYVNKRYKVPTKSQLQEKLSRHAQLRDLIKRRNVRLIDERDGIFTTLLEGRTEAGEVVIDKELRLEGWDAPVHLIVRRLPVKAVGSVNEYSEQGLIVRSGPTIFENTWFKLDSRPEASFFAGELTAPQAAAIIKAYDENNHDLGGPVRLLSRDRDGLVESHPYRKELARVVASEVKPLFDALATQMDSQKRQGKNLWRAFKVASDALKEQVSSILEEIEETELNQGMGDDQALDLVLIPPRRVATPGEHLSFTLRSPTELVGPIDVSVDQISSSDVISAFASSDEPWKPHSRLAAFQTLIFATVGLELGSATLRVQIGDYVARAEVVVVEASEHDDPAPVGLEINPRRSRVAPLRGKRLTLRAPLEYADQNVALSYSGVALDDVPNGAVLRPDPSGRWVTAVVRAQASSQRGEGVFTALTSDGQSADAFVTVDESAGRGGLSIDFELTGHKSPTRRVELQNDQGEIRIRVFALHQTFAGVFGAYDEVNGCFADEDSLQARAVLAEVMAGELAGHLTELDYARHPERLNDAPRVIRRRSEFANRLLVTLHRALKPGPGT